MKKIVAILAGGIGLVLVPLFVWMYIEISALALNPDPDPLEWAASEWSATDLNAHGRIPVLICDPQMGTWVEIEVTPPLRRDSPIVRLEADGHRFILPNLACE